MKMLAHRGLWQLGAPKNSLAAFAAAFDAGFGIEVDVRDFMQDLVISHDPPNGSEPKLQELIDMYVKHSCREVIAVNIKADGLADRVGGYFRGCNASKSYVAFDMSVPDTRGYIQAGIPFLSRHSDVEQIPSYEESAVGLWLDGFVQEADIGRAIRAVQAGKIAAIVSPELHRRPHSDVWKMWRSYINYSGIDHSRLMLCTDYPLEADKFFNEAQNV